MGTTKKVKTASTTIKKAETKKGSKKSAAMEQIEKLEKALEKTKEEDVTNLVPEDIRADIETEKEKAGSLETPEPVDLEKEVKRIFEEVKPSDELAEQIESFEKGKENFNKKFEKGPEDPEKLIQEEIKRVEKIKKKVESMKANAIKEDRKMFGSENFTNWWNGSSGLY